MKADIAQRGMALMHVATQIFDQHDLHSMAPLVVIDPCVKEATKTVEHSHLLVQRPSTIMLLDDLPFMNPTFVPFFATVLRTRYEGWKAARDARACEHDLLAWHTIVYMGEDANTATQALSRNQPSLLTLLCVMALPAV